MNNADWYRNTDWNDEIEKEFFNKFKRTRSQRDQYLVIQALTLVKTHPKIALRLVHYYFDIRNDKFHDVTALLTKAQALLGLQDVTKAIEAYHAVLAREEEYPNHLTNTYVDYPYIVATRRIKSEYKNALTILKKYEDRLTFPIDRFMWHASKALIEKDAEQASKALEAAEIKMSGFRYHQNLGLVGKEHKKTIKRLLGIVSVR